MILTFDIGNSNIVLGGYTNNTICFTSRITTQRNIEADQVAVELTGIFSLYGVEHNAITGVVISSVVPSYTPLLIQALTHFTTVVPMVLSLENAGDISINIDYPAELGMDILASALAVAKHYPLPAAIIDMGTATKISVLDDKKALQGVSIAPGVFVSLNALVNGTSLLSGIALSTSKPVAIGKNTTQSIQSGVLLGNASMLDGLLEHFSAEIGGFKTIVATGGAAPFIIPHCKNTIQYDDTLLLDGLYEAFLQNKK